MCFLYFSLWSISSKKLPDVIQLMQISGSTIPHFLYWRVAFLYVLYLYKYVFFIYKSSNNYQLLCVWQRGTVARVYLSMPENLSMKMNLCVWLGGLGGVAPYGMTWVANGHVFSAPSRAVLTQQICVCVYVNPACSGFGLIGWSTVSSFIDFMAEGKMQ